MKRMVCERSSGTVQNGNAVRPTLWHLAAMLAAVLAMICGAYLFNLTPEKLCTIGAANENLTHIKIFAICVIFLGMSMFLCDLLDWYEKQVSRNREQREERKGV